MKRKKPLIGVLPFYEYQENKTSVKMNYYDGINISGGLAMIIPVISDISILDSYVDICKGFLITGGLDVDPVFYNEPSLRGLGGVCPFRDEIEMYIAKKAFEKNKSVFGICRGMQVMNVALGGTLYQDIYIQQTDKNIYKHTQDAPRWFPSHEVIIEKNSRLMQIFNKERIMVNSFHHQSVKDLANGYRVTARAGDGTIEGIEYVEHPFFLGVQWHPEDMIYKYPESLKLFKGLVDSCK